MRALSTTLPAARRLLRSDGLQRWFVHEPAGSADAAHVIKQLAPSIAADAGLAQRWLDVVARNVELAHPGCTAVADWGVHEGSAYVVSQHPLGITLGGLLDTVRASGSRLAEQLVAPIGIMILEALDHAQQRDPALTHLALDLEAVRVRADGAVVLSEFALWSVLSPTDIARCRFDSGRVQYCAPELVQSRPGDCRSDVFSVGVLLYQLLTGELPFAGATQLAVALAIAEGQRQRTHQRVPDAPEALCDIVEVMLATRAEERFQTPAAAASALRSTLVCEAQTGEVRASIEPVPPPLCFPALARAPRDMLEVTPMRAPSPRPRSSGTAGCVSDPSPEPLAVNDGRTAYLRARPRPAAPRGDDDSVETRGDHDSAEPRQPPLLVVSGPVGAPAFAPLSALGLPASLARAPLVLPSGAAWSRPVPGDGWSEPSETVFQVKVRPAAAVRTARKAHDRAALPLWIALGLLAVVLLYLIHRLLP